MLSPTILSMRNKKAFLFATVFCLSLLSFGQHKFEIKGLSEYGDSILHDTSYAYTFIYAWATWCKPCISGIDTINALKETHQKVRFINIVYDSIYDYRRFKNRTGKAFNFETIINGETLIESIAKIKYKNIEKGLAFPILLIVDNRKNIVFMEKRISSKTYKRINDVLSKFY